MWVALRSTETSTRTTETISGQTSGQKDVLSWSLKLAFPSAWIRLPAALRFPLVNLPPSPLPPRQRSFHTPTVDTFSTGVKTGDVLASEVDSTANKCGANVAELLGQPELCSSLRSCEKHLGSFSQPEITSGEVKGVQGQRRRQRRWRLASLFQASSHHHQLMFHCATVLGGKFRRFF